MDRRDVAVSIVFSESQNEVCKFVALRIFAFEETRFEMLMMRIQSFRSRAQYKFY